jgi:hypothetical protein
MSKWTVTTLLLSSAFLFSSVGAFAQNANAVVEKPAAPAVYKSDLGFSYGYSADWQLIDTTAITPAAQQQAAASATSAEEKKGAACAQIGLMLKHGDPASIIMTVALPYDCYGSSFTDTDLPGFGKGVSGGLKQNFSVSETKTATFKSGTHSLWIERAAAVSKADPSRTYTIETVCSMLKKGATCWIGMVKDDAALKIMEQSLVTLESDAPTALVPENLLTPAKP